MMRKKIRGWIWVIAGVFAMGLLVDPSDVQAQKRRLLYFSKSSGFEHTCVKRHSDQISHTECIMMEIGFRNGYEVVCTKDGGAINAKNLQTFDAVAFFTSGDLLAPGNDKNPPVSAQGLKELFEWIKAGGGFSAWHAGLDTLRRSNANDPTTEYTKLVGGAFAFHGRQEPATVIVVDRKFPAMQRLPLEFRLHEEWYVYDQANVLKNMHVLQLLNTQSMEQGRYREKAPYPITWCSKYGHGRVFVTAIGHREDVWENAVMQQMVGDAIRWTFGDLPGDASPNFEEISQQYQLEKEPSR